MSRLSRKLISRLLKERKKFRLPFSIKSKEVMFTIREPRRESTPTCLASREMFMDMMMCPTEVEVVPEEEVPKVAKAEAESVRKSLRSMMKLSQLYEKLMSIDK